MRVSESPSSKLGTTAPTATPTQQGPQARNQRIVVPGGFRAFLLRSRGMSSGKSESWRPARNKRQPRAGKPPMQCTRAYKGLRVTATPNARAKLAQSPAAQVQAPAAYSRSTFLRNSVSCRTFLPERVAIRTTRSFTTSAEGTPSTKTPMN